MICCPTSKIAKPDVLGAIYRIQKKGVRPHADPRGLKLDWGNPQIGWLSDPRPYVVNRSIDALAKESNIDALREARARTPAVWSLHRIPSRRARVAVREFLTAGDSDVRAAAIHSVSLWRDRGALKLLVALSSVIPSPRTSQTICGMPPIIVVYFLNFFSSFSVLSWILRSSADAS